MAKLFGFSIEETQNKSDGIISPVPKNNEDGVDNYIASGFYGQYVDSFRRGNLYYRPIYDKGYNFSRRYVPEQNVFSFQPYEKPIEQTNSYSSPGQDLGQPIQNEYNTLDNIYQKLDSISNVKLKEKLINHPQKDFWHEKMIWYGPSGIGTARSLEGFIDHHQLPFRKTFKERNYWELGHYCELGDGKFSLTAGWHSIQAVYGSNDWLGYNYKQK